MKAHEASGFGRENHCPSRVWLALVVLCLTAVGANCRAAAPPAQATGVGNAMAGPLSRATDLGPMSSSSSIELTVWLKLRDSEGIDRTLTAQRTKGAGWLSAEQVDQLHAPATADVAAVDAFLKAQGLTVTGVGPHHLFVKARGTVAAVDRAFKVQLHQYTFGGVPFHASVVKPTLPSGIAPLVVSVGGLSDRPATPMIVVPRRGAGAWPNITHPGEIEGLPWGLVPLDGAVPQGVLFSAQCFYPPTTVSFSSSTATASYSGGLYGAAINNTAPGTLPPCGYQPSDLQKAYNLKPLYQAGLDGRGETIAIVDAFGSTTVQQDLAAFSTRMGLPPANLKVLGTSTASFFSSNPNLVSWAGETTLDVEWAHAVAPGANILLIVAPSQSIDDLMAANLTAAQQTGVVSISNSWGYVESVTDVPMRTAADGILKLAAAQGISSNFGSGDLGDFTRVLGNAQVSYPASSPYATGIGGVSVALDQNKHVVFQTAWGNNLQLLAGLATQGTPAQDPPIIDGFIQGSGGGVSNDYALPSFQTLLRRWGTRRLVPDISWVADPFTGVEFLVTADAQGNQSIGVAGGTSVATPMFSALWSIAAQKARRPLGQAAPLLYRLPPGAITDVIEPSSSANVTGTITDAGGTQQLTAEQLALPLQGQATFLSTLWNSPGTGTWFVLTFGTDSTLPAAPGWDPATGLGTPNGVVFVNAVASEARRTQDLANAGQNGVGLRNGATLRSAGLRNGTARVLSHSTDLGPLSSTSPIELTVWLNLRDTAGLERELAAQKANGAGWLSEEQIDRRHAPAAADAMAIGAFLRAHGLTVTGVGPHHLFVKARGTVGAVDAAFNVQLHQYSFRGMPFHATRGDPQLPANIASLVASVGGLSDLQAKPLLVHLGPGAWSNVRHPSDAVGLPWSLIPLSGASTSGLFSSQCFLPPATLSFSSATATASYSGRLYGSSADDAASPPPCGYQPSDLHTAYNLTPLYEAGLDGTGETVAIIDAYGSTTLQQDVARFSALMGLPSANLQILGTPTASNFSSDPTLLQWAGETTLDVEWAHAIAPGANILLVVAPTQSLDDLMAANLAAAQQPGVVSISNSWGYFESFTTVAARKATDSILKLATSRGIAVNFASGDYSNGALALGYADVAYPASSPYATGVGGVSVALDPNRRILFQTAWGNNRMLVAGAVAPGSPPADPPSPGGLGWGGGGGVSNVYPLPPFQAFLRAWGTRRLVPDISWVADPFTGVEVVVTVDSQGDQSIGLDGGTSVATPMFSALWSIAVQKARRPLGQAAPRLYSLPPWAITDVGAPVSFPNVTGTITDANGTQELTAEELAQPLQGQATLLSTLYKLPIPIPSWIVLSFGTDGQLHAGPGWDPATGLGTPNGAAFVNALSLR